MPSPTLPPAPTPTSTPTPSPTPQTPAEGLLRVAVVGAAPHWDLHTVVSEWATLFGPGPSHARVMQFTLGGHGSPSLDVECSLCSSWRFTSPLTFEFELDSAAMWQPAENFAQRPVSKHDVVFSLERLRSPGFPHASLLDSVDTIEAVGERSVRLNLRYPDPDLPLKLASPYAVVMAFETLVDGDARDAPVVGAGPWLFSQGASGQATLSAWDGHRSGARLETIEFLIANNAYVAAELLRQGRVDATHIPNELWPELEAAGFQSAIVERQGRGVLFGLNSRRPPFDDHALRRATIGALDLQAALDATFAAGAVGAGLPLLNDDWRLDGEEIGALLAGPPPPDGAPPFTLTVANFGETYVAHGQLLAQQLRDAGFDVRIDVLTRANYLRRVWQERDFDAFVGPMPPIDAPNGFLLGIAHSRGAANIAGGDPELDALIEAAAVELDPAARAELARSTQRLILERGYFVMAASLAERWAFDPKVRDFTPDMPMGAGDLWARVRVANPS